MEFALTVFTFRYMYFKYESYAHIHTHSMEKVKFLLTKKNNFFVALIGCFAMSVATKCDLALNKHFTFNRCFLFFFSINLAFLKQVHHMENF